jgi:hypothetical protein
VEAQNQREEFAKQKEEFKNEETQFGTEKDVFLSKKRKDTAEYFQTISENQRKESQEQELIQQFEDDRKKWGVLLQQFQKRSENKDPNQEESTRLEFLFLHHLSLHHSFQKERKEIDFLFQSILDGVLQSEDDF